MRRVPESEDKKLFALHRQREQFLKLKEWTERTARIAAAVVVLSNAPNLYPAAVEQSPDTLTGLDVHESDGSITTASGHTFEIPKAGGALERVTVYAPKGEKPDRVVVVYEQSHPVTEEDLQNINATEQYRARILAKIRYTQQVIYNQLKAAPRHDDKPTVCTEGIADDVAGQHAADYVQFFQEEPLTAISQAIGNLVDPAARAIFKRYDELTLSKGLTQAEVYELKNEIAPKMTPFLKSENLIANNAAVVLATEGQVHLCGAEEGAAHNAAFSASIKALEHKSHWTPAEYRYHHKVVIEDRNDAALRRTVAQGKELAYVVYGADHDFGAATARWDATHPGEQIAVVQVHFQKMKKQSE